MLTKCNSIIVDIWKGIFHGSSKLVKKVKNTWGKKNPLKSLALAPTSILIAILADRKVF